MEALKSIAILVPVFDDWECTAQLLPLMDAALARAAVQVHVVLVDDGSATSPAEDFLPEVFESISEVRVLRLRSNLGHQRAIAIGLYYVHQFLPVDAIVVMDGDGEDRPAHLPVLLDALRQGGLREMVFAARAKRLERPLFRFFYRLYRGVHRVLTGIPVRVGNFSVIPRSSVDRLMVSADLWNHYAAAAFRSRIPLRIVPLDRGTRLVGQSRMNFSGLVVHGLSAISVFADVVSGRLLVAATAFGIFSLLLFAAAVSAGFATRHAMPSWVAIAVGAIGVICLQAMMLSLVLGLAVISSRSNSRFIPLRDSEYYILEQQQLWAEHEPTGLRRQRTSAI